MDSPPLDEFWSMAAKLCLTSHDAVIDTAFLAFALYEDGLDGEYDEENAPPLVIRGFPLPDLWQLAAEWIDMMLEGRRVDADTLLDRVRHPKFLRLGDARAHYARCAADATTSHFSPVQQ